MVLKTKPNADYMYMAFAKRCAMQRKEEHQNE